MDVITRAPPATAAEMAAAVPGATFTHGWLINETSRNLEPAFGGVTLIASGTGIIYGDAGPRGGSDRSVGFLGDANTGKFSGGEILDIGSNTDELVVAWFGIWTAIPTVAFGAMFGKATPTFTNGWAMSGNDGTSISFALGPSTTYSATIAGTSAFLVGRPHVGIAVIDRSGTDSARFGVRELFGSTTVVSGPNTAINGSSASSSGSPFTIGRGDWISASNNFRLAGLYVGKGAGVAAGLAANLQSALATFADVIGQTAAANAYASMLAALFPPGRLWRFIGGVLSKLLLGCAEELMRVDSRVVDLLNEADPSTAVELLPEYERDLAIVAAATTAERRANIVARRVARQRFRPVDIRAALAPLLAQLAADVVIIERTRAFAIAVGDDREIFLFFVYRNPTLPGTYYVASAQALLNKIKPSHTIATVIESVSFLYDDPHSLYDRDLMGA